MKMQGVQVYGVVGIIWRIFVIHKLAFGFTVNDFLFLQDTGNYTCDEVKYWVGKEKHYSNRKKENLFDILDMSPQCQNPNHVTMPFYLNDVYYGYQKGSRVFKVNTKSNQCKLNDNIVVVFLSNYSINNNYSHFLHALLRLFCALIDAQLILWDETLKKFISPVPYAIWLDEWFKLSDYKSVWVESLGTTNRNGQTMIRQLGPEVSADECITSNKLLYGSGCLHLLPPEKWFGYPGCRAAKILPAFAYYIRQQFNISNAKEIVYATMKQDYDYNKRSSSEYYKLIQQDKYHKNNALIHEKSIKNKLSIFFAVRTVGDKTGKREISNLGQLQSSVQNDAIFAAMATVQNITFEGLHPRETVSIMSNIDIFVSVHGAGLTNMFFLKPGTVVVEVIPFPLCSCTSEDYFYGDGGYYHGSSLALNVKHYSYCVPSEDTLWNQKPKSITYSNSQENNIKCSWKFLHSVKSVKIDSGRFMALLRKIKRDLIASGSVLLTAPVIKLHPHANG